MLLSAATVMKPYRYTVPQAPVELNWNVSVRAAAFLELQSMLPLLGV